MLAVSRTICLRTAQGKRAERLPAGRKRGAQPPYRNLIDSQGTATTTASATANAARYDHIRPTASSGDTGPIAQAPYNPTPKGGENSPMPMARMIGKA
jgi:hypothetical protein